jgi:3-oxoacyl-[acyl-carrier-protein] synthase-1
MPFHRFPQIKNIEINKKMSTQRVVITGIGIVSSIGNDQQSVQNSLYEGKSGISFSQEYADLGFRSQVYGCPEINFEELIPRKVLRFMGGSSAYSWIAMQQAIEDAGLDETQQKNPRTGLIAGSGGASTSNVVESAKIAVEQGVKRVGPYRVTRTMGSTVSACLGTSFGIQGTCYSISSACATGAHCVGNAYELIQSGKQDIIFAGAGEELDWSQSILFDAMGAMSSKYNDTPEKASRAFDKDRDGFVIAGGAGMVVLESLESAQKRGAKIYGEIVGYGATSDGFDMVQPSGEGAIRCMQLALDTCSTPIDYINVHGTSTPVGDMKELSSIRQVFGEKIPYISSTKSMTGHSLGAAGVQELIYSLIMMDNDFACASINIENLDEQATGLPILTERKDMKIGAFMSNGFGFGGTNATLVVQKS